MVLLFEFTNFIFFKIRNYHIQNKE